MKLRLVTTVCTIASAMMAAAQVPSLINYQGRLTDANGVPVTGSKNFSLSIYDTATGGNLLYTESIGAVTLDANGVYSFQFGSAGTSNSQVTETIATTDASTLVYTKALANQGVVENSLSVTDGTNSWTQSTGNPGVGASATANTIAGFVIGATITNGGSGYTSPPEVTITGLGSGAAATATLTGGVVTEITITNAGSGYTGGASISIAQPVIPFRVEYSSGSITATYSSASTAGQAITATYRYGTNGITGALGGSPEQWMEVGVDGTPQGTRQRIVAVPFAITAINASWASEAITARQAASLADRPTTIKPDIFHSIGPVYTPITLPISGNSSCYAIVPSILKKIKSIEITYYVHYETQSGASTNDSSVKIELMKTGVDGIEQVLTSFASSGSPQKSGEFQSTIPADFEMDVYSKYWIRVSTIQVTRNWTISNNCYIKTLMINGIW